ncbi:MAG: exodeoxyribonuclease VII large subunit, partial [Eubacteriales bacterium]
FVQRGYRVNELKEKLTALSPAGILSRGFARITDMNGNLVKSAEALNKGDAFSAAFADGVLEAEVTQKRSENK